MGLNYSRVYNVIHVIEKSILILVEIASIRQTNGTEAVQVMSWIIF